MLTPRTLGRVDKPIIHLRTHTLVPMQNSESGARAIALLDTGGEAIRSNDVSVSAHVESHESARTGDFIRVSCDCAISSDHTYVEWLNASENASIDL